MPVVRHIDRVEEVKREAKALLCCSALVDADDDEGLTASVTEPANSGVDAREAASLGPCRDGSELMEGHIVKRADDELVQVRVVAVGLGHELDVHEARSMTCQ